MTRPSKNTFGNETLLILAACTTRKKLETIALTERCEALKEVNLRLKEENQLLISLVKESKRLAGYRQLAEVTHDAVEFFYENKSDKKIAATPKKRRKPNDWQSLLARMLK